jgi:selenocysteine-specific elongation factor
VGKRLYHRRLLAQLSATIDGLVTAYARRFPLRLGIPKEEARRRCKFPGGSAEWNAVCQHLAGQSDWVVAGDRIAVTPEGPALEPEMAAAVAAAGRELAAFGLDWPGLDEWVEGSAAFAGAAADPRLREFKAPEVLRHLVDHGHAVAVSNEYHVATAARQDLLRRLGEYFEREAELPFAVFRELSGLTRKLGIPMLEHLDQAGVTVRAGDVRRAGPALEHTGDD